MKKLLLILIAFTGLSVFSTFVANGQGGVGINSSGNNPDPSAIIDASSTTKGALIPRMTTAERDAIGSPAQSLMIYNLSKKCLEIFEYGVWQSIFCPCPPPIAPAVNAGSNISQTSFSANWSASVTAINYFLDVATDAGFTSLLPGYNNLSVGNVTTYSISGLTCNTTYYYRVRAANTCGTGINSTVITVNTSACIPPNTWTQMNNFGSTARYAAVGFSIGTKGYLGTGNDGANKKDFWEWDQSTGVWTQKADLLGAARYWAVGFSISTKGYIGTGIDGTSYYNDFYEWDQAGNLWTAKANFPGTARYGAVGFSIGAKGYIGTGSDPSLKQDFYEWDQAGNTWSAKAPFPNARYDAVGFSIGAKGYLGTGFDGVYKNDFYEYNPANNTWTVKAPFIGGGRTVAFCLSIGTKGYIGTGHNGSNFTNDFYEWDQANNMWTPKTNFAGPARGWGVAFSIGTKGYVGTGGGNANYNDFYEYQQ